MKDQGMTDYASSGSTMKPSTSSGTPSTSADRDAKLYRNILRTGSNREANYAGGFRKVRFKRATRRR